MLRRLVNHLGVFLRDQSGFYSFSRMPKNKGQYFKTNYSAANKPFFVRFPRKCRKISATSGIIVKEKGNDFAYDRHYRVFNKLKGNIHDIIKN